MLSCINVLLTYSDLHPILCTVEEGIFHVTSTPRGFFVNRCTRTVFDPRPAPNPHFSHELFTTLLDVSSSLRASWHSICANANASVDEGEEGGDEGSESEELNADSMNSGALDVVTALCSQVITLHICYTSLYHPSLNTPILQILPIKFLHCLQYHYQSSILYLYKIPFYLHLFCHFIYRSLSMYSTFCSLSLTHSILLQL